MKIKPIHAVPFVFSTFIVAANAAEKPDFTQADLDQDGKLSITEATTALPELEITDENEDGLVNVAEVKQVVENVEFPEQVEADEANAPVGMEEYRLIVQAMESTEEADV